MTAESLPSPDWLPFLWIALSAYLVGSISFAILVSRFRGLHDPRSYGSKNPGATNILRSGDKQAAALTLLGDAGKGLLVVWLVGELLSPNTPRDLALALAGLAVFLGHLYPIYFRFQGGKGVATALGVLLGLSATLGLATLATWLLVFKLSRISSLSALSAASLAPLYLLLGWGPVSSGDWQNPLFAAVLIMVSLLLIRHRENIRGLLAGSEKKV